jgi:type IV fimbrial biogenesis protein FimT
MNTMQTHRRPAEGFTIIELMVVIAIVAVFMVVAIPSYKSVTTQSRMAGEINDLASDIALARSAAVKQGMTVTICPSANPSATPSTSAPACSGSTSWSTGWIVFIDTAGNQTFTTNGDTLLRVHGPFTGSDTLVLSSTSSTPTSITFNRMGGTTSFGAAPDFSNTGTLTLHDSTNNAAWRRCVVLSEAGTITVYSPQNNKQGSCP